MERKKRIEEEVDKTLESFDTFERIEPSPFFTTRLQARIKEFEQRQERTLSSWFRPSRLRPALIAVLLVLNLLSAVTVIRLFQASRMMTSDREQYLAAVVEEYGLDQNTYYLPFSQQ